MQFHFLFLTVKTAGPHLIPIKSYSKNTHPSSFLKRIIGSNRSEQLIDSSQDQEQYSEENMNHCSRQHFYQIHCFHSVAMQSNAAIKEIEKKTCDDMYHSDFKKESVKIKGIYT
jgi:hypothetical protein